MGGKPKFMMFGYPQDLKERGAALVEAAIVVPVLIVVVFGCIEFGLLYIHASSLSTATRAGARTAAATVDTPTEDFDIVQSIFNSKSRISDEDVKRIVIYRATSENGQPPEACKAGNSQQGECNVYESGTFTNQAAIESRQTFWPPSSREFGEFIGVYVETNHKFVTQLFGSSKGVRDSAVMVIEKNVANEINSDIHEPETDDGGSDSGDNGGGGGNGNGGGGRNF